MRAYEEAYEGRLRQRDVNRYKSTCQKPEKNEVIDATRQRENELWQEELPQEVVDMIQYREWCRVAYAVR